MNEIKTFQNDEFGLVRTCTGEDGKIMFCGKDVAQALGYKDTNNALKTHCKKDGVAFHHLTDSLGRIQDVKFISEGNLYRLIAHSKLPSAERFENWAFDEVLPSIRRHGTYMTESTVEKVFEDPEFLLQLVLNFKKEKEQRIKLESKIENDRPKVIFADAVDVSKSTILVGDLAKIIKQNGVDIGANRLFAWLRENGYLISRKGADYNSPTQKSMELGLFSIKEAVVTHSDGHTTISKTPKVTGKGQQYFVNKFLANEQKVSL